MFLRNVCTSTILHDYRENLRSYWNISLLDNVQTASGAHTASYSVGTGGCFPMEKRSGCSARHTPHLVSKFKKSWSHTSNPLYMSFITGVVPNEILLLLQPIVRGQSVTKWAEGWFHVDITIPVLIYVTSWADPRAIVRLEGSNDLIGTRTRNLPACSIVPQSTTLPRAVVHHTKFHELKNFLLNLLQRGQHTSRRYNEILWS
jgi:hypothetical protein